MEESDPRTIAAARSGDTRAFEVLVRKHQSDVWRLCFHILGAEAPAEDATQETFLRAFRFLRRYRGDSRFSTWLLSIARNCAMDEARRAGRSKRVAEAVRAEADARLAPADNQRALEVREALAELPLELREPVLLIDMFGASYSEVARILGIPEGTVKSRMHRAREVLMRSLRAEAEESSGEA